MPDEERGVAIRNVPGRVTWMLDFKRVYEDVTGERPCNFDRATMDVRVSDFKHTNECV
jgi:hypothetical protein